MAFCKIQVIGNLGRDPELRYTPNGRPVLVDGRFRSREYETKDGRKGLSLEITADNVIPLDRREQEGTFAGAPGAVAGPGGAGGGAPGGSGARFGGPGREQRPPPVLQGAAPGSGPAAAARCARSARTRPSRSTTRRSTASAATCPSARRSNRVARPAPAPDISAGCRAR